MVNRLYRTFANLFFCSFPPSTSLAACASLCSVSLEQRSWRDVSTSLRLAQLDRAYYPHPHRPQCHRPYYSSRTLHYAPRRDRQQSKPTSTTCRRLLSYLGGLCFVCAIYSVHVRASSFRRKPVRSYSCYRVEAFARIVTTGFILDPDVPTSALYKGLFSISSFPPTVSRSHSLNSQSRLGMGSLNMSQSYSSSGSSTLANLNRSGSSSYRNGLAGRARPKLNDVFHQMRENIAKPFALAHHQNHGSLSVGTAMGMNTVGAVEHALGRQPSYSGSEKEKSGSGAGSGTSTGIVAVTVTNSSASSSVGNGFVSRNGPGYGNGHAYAYPYGNIPPPHHIPDPRDPTKNTFFSRAFRSEPIDAAGAGGINEKAKEYLGLPFRLAVYTAQDHVSRNVPYLRHSWNRIDFIAIVAFWITFVLASAGAEREAGGRHISVFRALSVLRTARLLAVTNGTTVSGLFHFI